MPGEATDLTDDQPNVTVSSILSSNNRIVCSSDSFFDVETMQVQLVSRRFLVIRFREASSAGNGCWDVKDVKP